MKLYVLLFLCLFSTGCSRYYHGYVKTCSQASHKLLSEKPHIIISDCVARETQRNVRSAELTYVESGILYYVTYYFDDRVTR